jgi:hypothetical protein
MWSNPFLRIHPMAKRSAILDPIDGLIVDEVGAWASEKHDRLRKYIDAYRSVRALYLPPKGTGGAGYMSFSLGRAVPRLKERTGLSTVAHLSRTRQRNEAKPVSQTYILMISIAKNHRRLRRGL